IAQFFHNMDRRDPDVRFMEHCECVRKKYSRRKSSRLVRWYVAAREKTWTSKRWRHAPPVNSERPLVKPAADITPCPPVRRRREPATPFAHRCHVAEQPVAPRQP